MNWKKALYNVGYILPGVGVYREIRKPKDKRSALGTIGFGIYAIPFVIKMTYFGVGIITQEWNPINYFKDNIKKIENKKIDSLRINQEIPKKNKRLEMPNRLEKNIHYEDILK